MENDWKILSLGEIAENVSRPFNFSGRNDVVFINTGDVLEGKFLHSKRESPNGLPGQAKKRIERGDILFSEIRPANKRYALVDFDSDDFVVSTKFMVLRLINETIDPKFFYIQLTSSKILNDFQKIAESRSGTFPQITFDSVSYYPFHIPSIIEQRAIAHILGSLDDKIELNRRMNQTLEQMARAIFKSWFVDFDPVRAKAEGRDTGLPDEIAELFPDGFESRSWARCRGGGRWVLLKILQHWRCKQSNPKKPHKEFGNIIVYLLLTKANNPTLRKVKTLKVESILFRIIAY
jgi:type I restriction enzyme, S subunit